MTRRGLDFRNRGIKLGGVMKNNTSHCLRSLILVVSALALSVPAVRAEVADTKSAAKAKKAEHDAEMLAKYDANKDGKLDAVEKAAMKADADKAKAESKASAKKMKKE